MSRYPITDWTYSEECGCKVTFTGESQHHTSRMMCCEEHNKQESIYYRDALRIRAHDALLKSLAKSALETIGECPKCGGTMVHVRLKGYRCLRCD
jgi:hypothetical protein